MSREDTARALKREKKRAKKEAKRARKAERRGHNERPDSPSSSDADADADAEKREASSSYHHRKDATDPKVAAAALDARSTGQAMRLTTTCEEAPQKDAPPFIMRDGRSEVPPEGGAPVSREAWMGLTTVGGEGGKTIEDAAVGRDRTRGSAAAKREAEAARSARVAAERELNPYWRDGGDGAPKEAPKGGKGPGAADDDDDDHDDDDDGDRSKDAGPGSAAAAPPGSREAPGAALVRAAGTGTGAPVGDGGASWRLKALRRAKERAAEEGRSLAQVVTDRWGSVAQLVESIGGKDGTNIASDRAHLKRRRGEADHPPDACFRCGAAGHFARECPGRDGRLDPRSDDDRRGKTDRSVGRAGYLDDVGSAGRPKMRVPPSDGALRGHVSSGGRQREGDVGSARPRGGLSERDRRLLATASRAANQFASDGSFMDQFGVGSLHGADDRSSPRAKEASASASFGWTPGGSAPEGEGRGFDRPSLAAEVVSEEEEEDDRPTRRPTGPPSEGIDRRLAGVTGGSAREDRREARNAPPRPTPMPTERPIAAAPPGGGPGGGNRSAAAALRARLLGKGDSPSPSDDVSTVETLPLVTADGRAAPGAFGRATTLGGGVRSAEGAVRRPPRTTQRYDKDGEGGAGERARYFRDDDDASLRDLVAAHKHGAVEDYDRNLAANIARAGRRYKGAGTEREREMEVDDEYEHDVGLEKGERRDARLSDAERQRRAKARAVEEYRRSQVAHSKCQYCLDSPARPKHLHVAYGNLAYLMLPPAGRLVPGHCVIAPIAHCASTRAVDEDAWEEIRNFKKCLVKMFAAQGKECCFVETVVKLRGGGGVVGAAMSKHCYVECIPIPHDVADRAPMYFKKAIDEAESEWSTHDAKKCISTAPPKGLRGAIPPNFPYFHVEFNMRGGFVHVIDDDDGWRVDFARDILVGLLDLPENASRAKQRPLAPAVLKREMDHFLDKWDAVDWTKQLG